MRLKPRTPTYRQEITKKYRSPKMSSAAPKWDVTLFARANRPSKKSVSSAARYNDAATGHKVAMGHNTTKPNVRTTLAILRLWTAQNQVSRLLEPMIITCYQA